MQAISCNASSYAWYCLLASSTRSHPLCCDDSCAESSRTGPVTHNSAAQRSALRFRAADPGETPIGSLVAHGEIVCVLLPLPFCPPRLLGKSRLLLTGRCRRGAGLLQVTLILSCPKSVLQTSAAATRDRHYGVRNICKPTWSRTPPSCTWSRLVLCTPQCPGHPCKRGHAHITRS